MTTVAVVADLMDGDDNVSGAILDDRMYWLKQRRYIGRLHYFLGG